MQTDSTYGAFLFLILGQPANVYPVTLQGGVTALLMAQRSIWFRRTTGGQQLHNQAIRMAHPALPPHWRAANPISASPAIPPRRKTVIRYPQAAAWRFYPHRKAASLRFQAAIRRILPLRIFALEAQHQRCRPAHRKAVSRQPLQWNANLAVLCPQ